MKDDTSVLQLGERPGFVLGNGPSLKGFDLHSLSPFTTIGMNAAYRYWDRIAWRPTHYACLDTVVGLSHINGIRRLIREGRNGAVEGMKPIRQFLLRQNLIEALGADADDVRVLNFDALRLHTGLLQINPITTGSHALLWAHLIGCDSVVLMGIDGNYKEIVDGAEQRNGIVLEITEQKSNPNYFFEDYQQPGDKYNVPNPVPDLHVSAWHKAAVDLAKTGPQIANANPMSEVRVFPFVNATELVARGAAPLQPAAQQPYVPPGLDQAAVKLRQKRELMACIGVPLAMAVLVGLGGALFGIGVAIFLLAMMLAIAIGLLAYLLNFALPRRSRRHEETDIQLFEIERQMRSLTRDRVT